jgi:hypothetical protein
MVEMREYLWCYLLALRVELLSYDEVVGEEKGRKEMK